MAETAQRVKNEPSLQGKTPSGTIWIDLDNAPQAVFFAPIVRELERRGANVFLTARDVNRTPEMARHQGLDPLIVGKAFSKSKVSKVVGTLLHGVRLARATRGVKPALAVSHGSRGQAVSAWLKRTPLVVFFDYEMVDLRIFRATAKRYYYPQALHDELTEDLPIPDSKRCLYPGLKEHLLLLGESGDPSELTSAGIPTDSPYAVIRPESDIAHYLDGLDDSCLFAAIDKCAAWGLKAVVVPRSPSQKTRLAPLLARYAHVTIPEQAVSGRTLLERSSLLISGGGTMNREAVVLGVPCVSIFRGRVGALDRSMIRRGQMIHAPHVDDVSRLSAPPRREQTRPDSKTAQGVLDFIVDNLLADVE